MIKKVLKKHISNLINDNKIDILESLRKQFIGTITYVNVDDFEFTINTFTMHEDFNEHVKSYNDMLAELKNKRDIAIIVNNFNYDDLYLVADYLSLEDIHLSLDIEQNMDDEWWELFASVSELMGQKITRDSQGKCVQISYS